MRDITRALLMRGWVMVEISASQSHPERGGCCCDVLVHKSHEADMGPWIERASAMKVFFAKFFSSIRACLWFDGPKGMHTIHLVHLPRMDSSIIQGK